VELQLAGFGVNAAMRYSCGTWCCGFAPSVRHLGARDKFIRTARESFS
jgi:hypothetical protein